MALKKLDIKTLKGLFLSPGNIIWKQKYGAEISIALKGEFLNQELVAKLSNANHEVLIEDQIDTTIQEDIVNNFKLMEEEKLVKDKILYRKRILKSFYENFYSKDIGQFDFDQICWKVFSRVSAAQGKKLLDTDLDLFRRSMSVASSYTIIAFFLGYYDEKFLQKIYTSTFLALADIADDVSFLDLKESLEEMRSKNILTEADHQLLEKSFRLDHLNNFFGFERSDGSGYKKFKKEELTELEIALFQLCNHYSYVKHDGLNILRELNTKNVFLEEKTMNTIASILLNYDPKSQVENVGAA